MKFAFACLLRHCPAILLRKTTSASGAATLKRQSVLKLDCELPGTVMFFLFSVDLRRNGTKPLVCLLAAVAIRINPMITSLCYILDDNFSGQGIGWFVFLNFFLL